jgi:hypothetical protein
MLRKLLSPQVVLLIAFALITPTYVLAQDDFGKDMEKWAESFSQQMEEMSKQIAQSSDKDIKIDIPKIKIDIPKIKIPKIKIPKIPNIGEINDKFEGEIVSDVIKKSFDVKTETPLLVDCMFSSISIEPGEDNAKISITIEKKAGAETEELAKGLLETIKINIEKTNDGVELNIKFHDDKKKLDKNMRHCVVKILTPVSTPIEMRNSFGDVVIKNTNGKIESENKFGSTFIQDTKGELNAKAEYGTLSIVNHQGNSKVNNQFGDLKIIDLTGNLFLKSGYGNSIIQTDLANAQIEGQISFGNIKINIPKDYSGSIKASSSFGSIKAPSSLEKKSKMFNESVKGTIGEGKGKIDIKTSYTEVNITQGKLDKE